MLVTSFSYSILIVVKILLVVMAEVVMVVVFVIVEVMVVVMESRGKATMTSVWCDYSPSSVAQTRVYTGQCTAVLRFTLCLLGHAFDGKLLQDIGNSNNCGLPPSTTASSSLRQQYIFIGLAGTVLSVCYV